MNCILESVVYSYIVSGANRGNTITDDLFEFFLDILADDKYYMVETSLNRIIFDFLKINALSSTTSAHSGMSDTRQQLP